MFLLPDECVFNDTVVLAVSESLIKLDSVESQISSILGYLDDIVPDFQGLKDEVSDIYNSGVSDIRSSVIFNDYVKFKMLLVFFEVISLFFPVVEDFPGLDYVFSGSSVSGVEVSCSACTVPEQGVSISSDSLYV